ncbi:MAG: HD domain-containing phosphohydrolase [Rhodoferax sp.]
MHQIELEMQNEELRRSQAELDTSQARYFDFYDMAPVGYCTVSGSGLILQVNLTAAALFGIERKELTGKPIIDFIVPDDQDIYYLMRMQIQSKAEVQSCDLRMLRRDELPFLAHLVTMAVPDDGTGQSLRIVLTDSTKLKLAELALRDSNAYLENLINYANAPIIVWDTQLHITRFNHAFELLSGRHEADVIGLPLTVLFPPEFAQESMALIRQTLTGERWSHVEIDIQHQDQSIHKVQWNSATIYAPDGQTVQSVIAQGQDITEKVQAQEEVKRYIAELQTAFMGAVEVATQVTEIRDPYTAGHERRVAAIAVAIGSELGLDARQQEGLNVAGHLHDIGKIGIPAEILTRPGKLKPLEYQLIQGHVQFGYEILNQVKFPWTIAEIVLQHHERMDGSGYPQGLKGDAIQLNARIIGVADVVEAMSSSRPYRPAFGVAAALSEIERGRGSLFDATVVDACLHLFREKGYAIPD